MQGCQVKVHADRAETEPKVFTRIVMQFIVSGVKLSEPAVRRAVQMSYDKYCSATAMLAKTAEIELQVEVVDTSAPAAA